MSMHDGSEHGRETEDRQGCERGPDDAAKLILRRDPQHPPDHERIADALDRATDDEPDDETDDAPMERAEEEPAENDRHGRRERAELRLVAKVQGEIDDVGVRPDE